jgi:type IV pilus assembly protein PilW
MKQSTLFAAKRTIAPQRYVRPGGFSLVELLIALALGLVIVAAMSQLFVNISRTNIEMAKTNSQIENARFAMQFLQGDIIHAGFWGGFIPEFDDLTVPGTPTDLPTAKPTPVCLPYTAPADWNDSYRDALFGIPVEVYGPTATPAGCGAVVTDRLAGTDLLIVRHASTCVAGEANCEAFSASKLYVQVSNCEDDAQRVELDPGEYILQELDCATVEARRKYVQNIYYIRDWANVNAPKDGIPTLVRSEFDVTGGIPQQQAPVALVEGIERFRVEVGIDRDSQTGELIHQDAPILWVDVDSRTTPSNRGDGVPETGFERCLSEDVGCTAVELSNVVAVKLYLLARANEVTQGYTDTKSYTLGSAPAEVFNNGFKRHLFSATIRINNVAGRRETPFDPSEVVIP